MPGVFALNLMAKAGLAGQIAAGSGFGGLRVFALASSLGPVLAPWLWRLQAAGDVPAGKP